MKKSFIPFLLILFFIGCTKDKKEKLEEVNSSGFPNEVGAILINKCATAGCHNTESAEGANGLDYSTWDNMFKGGSNGSSVIPYSTDYSYMLYFVNTDTTLGLALEPKMPFNTPQLLSKAEYLTLKNWIADGAPNAKGFVKFSDDPNRKKFYVCMQACDQVAVFDAASKVIMRYVKVGVDNALIEGPHQVKVTPDGKYWCVAFISGHVLQIFNTSDDKFVASVEIKTAQWNTMVFSPDSKMAYVASLSPAWIAPVNLTTFTAGPTITGIASPHGQYITKDGSTLYVTSQYGNIISKLSGPNLSDITGIQISTGPSCNPHEIAFTPDESKYFVSCQATNEVRVFRTSDDSLLAILPVGTMPQEFSLSLHLPYIFVTCTEDPLSATQKGSVYVFNYLTNAFIKKIYTGFQPHGIAVNDDQMIAYVANLNYDANAPAPHHVTYCGGKNGNMAIIDLNTLDLLQTQYPSGNFYTYRNEVLPYPYYVSYRK